MLMKVFSSKSRRDSFSFCLFFIVRKGPKCRCKGGGVGEQRPAHPLVLPSMPRCRPGTTGASAGPSLWPFRQPFSTGLSGSWCSQLSTTTARCKVCTSRARACTPSAAHACTPAILRSNLPVSCVRNPGILMAAQGTFLLLGWRCSSLWASWSVRSRSLRPSSPSS